MQIFTRCACVSWKSKGHTHTHRLPALILFASFHAFSAVSVCLAPAQWRYIYWKSEGILLYSRIASNAVRSSFEMHIIINHFRWFFGIFRSLVLIFLFVFGRLVAWLVDWTGLIRSHFVHSFFASFQCIESTLDFASFTCTFTLFIVLVGWILKPFKVVDFKNLV